MTQRVASIVGSCVFLRQGELDGTSGASCASCACHNSSCLEGDRGTVQETAGFAS